jgi:hypothetical protein
MLSIRTIAYYAGTFIVSSLCPNLASAASISDLVPFTADSVVFQEPGQPAVLLLFDEGGAEFTANPFLTRLIPFRAGLQDKLVRFTEPTSDPDHPLPNSVSDILGLKVTPALGNQQQIQLSFWSDNLDLSAAQFELSLGLVNPVELSLPETGELQDLNGSLFGSGASPFTQLLVGSDLNNNAVAGGGGIFGDSDFVSLEKGNKPIVARAFNEKPVPESSLHDLTAGVDVFDKTFTLAHSLTDAVIPFAESINDQDTSQDISDVLTMRVEGDCTKAPGCSLIFGFWSEDPGVTEADFVADANLKDPRTPELMFPEISHPSVAGFLFAELGPDPMKWPYQTVTISSDPPVPEPQTITLISGGFFVFLWYARKRNAELR